METSTNPTARADADPSVDPFTGTIAGVVEHSTPDQVDRVVSAARSVAAELAATAPAIRRRWIEAVVASLLEHRQELAELAQSETALGMDRLRGEVGKACDNASFYGLVAVDGAFIDASTETIADGSRLSRWNEPLGPIAVFGASNFPFAYGSFGHDAASAIAAGCPVVVKSHPAQPRLASRLSELVVEALAASGAPTGTYGSVVGFDAGLRLVDSPAIRAVGFTGSQAGGMALVERGSRRGIPVFAEMGTVNPVLVTPDAAPLRDSIANGFVASFTLGAGQYCTKPGLLLVPAGVGFPDAVRLALSHVGQQTLLTRRIADAYLAGSSRLASAASGVPPEPGGPDGTSDAGFTVTPRLVEVTLDQLSAGSPLLDECFGPVALICEYDDLDSALEAVTHLQPSLAASVFAASESGDTTLRAVRTLLPQVGRVAVNAWPTGVLASWSQQHGGPWPATSRSDATSVGAGALRRFVRPVAIQNGDIGALSPALAADNPWHIPRRIDGRSIPAA
ncbi:aldehyde dehydrogenase family protein [Glaciihabitans sp. UYNi722]|uniref:aldehyde dehydrogenase family protein n=1 Tax=Glaciihabitans sp. UYNi722 TaxID=3156344 RepID=UPI0033939F89